MNAFDIANALDPKRFNDDGTGIGFRCEAESEMEVDRALSAAMEMPSFFETNDFDDVVKGLEMLIEIKRHRISHIDTEIVEAIEALVYNTGDLDRPETQKHFGSSVRDKPLWGLQRLLEVKRRRTLGVNSEIVRHLESIMRNPDVVSAMAGSVDA